MKLDMKFSESEQSLNAKFMETERFYNLSFKNVVVVERTDIPPEYGLITYDHNKTITVS